MSVFANAVRVSPQSTVALNNLGFALLTRGRVDEARDKLESALRIDPTNPDTNYHLALVYEVTGNSSRAVTHYRLSLKMRPNFAPAANNLAWILVISEDRRIRNPREALKLARRAASLTRYREPEVLDTLAAAFFATGQPRRAVETAAKAERLARLNGNTRLAEDIRVRAKEYR